MKKRTMIFLKKCLSSAMILVLMTGALGLFDLTAFVEARAFSPDGINDDLMTEDVTVTAISLSDFPNKLDYHINDILDTDGLELKVVYSDSEVAYISDGFTCTPTELTQKGEQVITVTYEGKTCKFCVWVKEPYPVEIDIKNFPEKNVFTVGDTLDPNGITLEVTYSDGTKKVISEGFLCAPSRFMEVNENQTVTVKYGDLIDTFTVTVISGTDVEGIDIPSELLLYKNDKEKIIATITPDKAINKNVIWASDNSYVALVDQNGIVTAIDRGTAIITAKTEDGGFVKTCTVTVKYNWWQWILEIFLFGWIWY